MRTEKLVPLAVALLVLIVFGLIFKRKPGRVDIEEQYQVTALVPKDFLVADVHRAEFYRGKDPAAGVRLARTLNDKSEPIGWKITSRFDAPGDATRIDELLKSIRDREGEFRAGKSEALADFELSDETAVHIALYKKDGAEPALHLLVGKAEGRNGCFVRRAGESDVYALDVNLRTSLGMWGNEPDKQPEAGEWLSKIVMEVDKSRMARIDLTWPDKRLSLQKKEIEIPVDNGQGGDAKDGEPKPAPKKETRWEVVAGGPKVAPDGALAPVKEGGITRLLGKLEKIDANDVVDPTKKAEYGLEPPTHRCEITLDDGSKRVIVGGRPEPGGDGYAMVEGTPGPVFQLVRYQFEMIFVTGNEIFEFRNDPVAQDEKVERLRVRLGDGSLLFARSKNETQQGWDLVEPQLSPAPGVRQDKVDDLADRFSSWRPADYGDAADAKSLGLAPAQAGVELATTKGRDWKIALGKASPCIQGYYAEVTDGTAKPGVALTVPVCAGSDAALALAPLGSYLDLKVFGVDAAQVSKITATRADKSFVVARKVEDGKPTGPWSLQAAAGEQAVDAGKLNALVSVVSALTASDLRVGADAGTAPALASVALTYVVETADGKSISLAFGPEKDGKVLAIPAGRPYALVFPPNTPQDLAPDPATFLSVTAAPEKSGKEEEPVKHEDGK